MYKASDVKELRERTGSGMLDCKKALEECNGDIEQAIDYLRKKGMNKAAKKESRIAAEGICTIKIEGENAVILEVNSETDFVAKNNEFIDFTNYLADALLNNEVTTVEEALQIKDGEETINDKLIALIAKIGEKISFRRFEKITKESNESFGSYIHMGGRIGSLIVGSGVSEDVLKDVAMHAAAMNPICVTKEEVPEEVLNHEKEIIKEQVMNEGKPADIAEKMVNGRINKFYKENCLVEQEFVKDSSINVGTFVKNNGGQIKSMIRFAVGEGIEKKEEDFASEVMNQVNATK
ncbi:MAG: elongation factor Ts [Bacilli bacterium]|nr:elongation factor Ts [Bacilli bacterium]